MKRAGKSSLWILLIIVFLDMFGVGIVYPILPLVFIKAQFATVLSETTREILLGALIASYPLAQFFGAPILGKLSDKHGRKPVLAISLAGSAVGYALFAVGLLFGQIWLLFLSRILDGFTGGNISVAFSAIADLSDETNKTQNFGLLGMVFGLGFITGPFVGGILSDESFAAFFGPAVPFWLAAFLVGVTTVLTVLFFKETIRERIHKKINAFSGVVDIVRTLGIRELRALFVPVFFSNFGWAFFAMFFPVFLADQFSLGNGMIGMLLGYVGVWAAISQGVFLRPVAKRMNAANILKTALFISPLMLLLVLIPSNISWLYLILPLMAMPFAFTQPSFSTLLSTAVSEKSQGEVMGIRQSYISLAHTIPPLIAGYSLRFGSYTPILFASISILIAFTLFVALYKGHGTTVEL